MKSKMSEDAVSNLKRDRRTDEEVIQLDNMGGDSNLEDRREQEENLGEEDENLLQEQEQSLVRLTRSDSNNCRSVIVPESNVEEKDYKSRVRSILKDVDLPFVERCIWIALGIISFAISLFLMTRVWQKWGDEPIIFSSEERSPVRQIPFPAITICSESKVARSVFDVTDHYIKRSPNLSDELKKKREVVSIFCNRNITNFVQEKRIDNALTDKDITFLETLPPYRMYESFHVCMFNADRPCESNRHVLRHIMTDEGVCYTWNMLRNEDFYAEGLNSRYLKDLPSSKGWNKEEGYTESLNWNSGDYPLSYSLSGKRSGVILTVSVNGSDMDDICTESGVKGFKVYLHNPTEMISSNMDHFFVPLEKEIEIAVKPEKVKTDPSLKWLELNKRQCYYPDERKLAHYKVYTQQNCQLECLNNLTINQCGCTFYYMPRSSNISICGLQKTVYCIGGISEGLTDWGEVENVNKNIIPYVSSNCDCLPACSSLKYEGVLKAEKVLNFKANMGLINKTSRYKDKSRIRVYYNEDHFVTKRRHQFYGYLDFFADCGGLLALFCGLSILSFMRVLYLVLVQLIDKRKLEMNGSISDGRGVYRPRILSPVEEQSVPSLHVNPAPVVKDAPPPSKGNVFMNSFLYYCKNSSLPVLKYTVEDRPWIERCLWIFVTILGFVVSAYYISLVVMKWYKSPIVFSLLDQAVHVYDIPFPAVTICSLTKVRPSIFNFTDFYRTRGSPETISKQKEYGKAACIACGKWKADLLNKIDPNGFYEYDVKRLVELGKPKEFEDLDDTIQSFKPILTMNGLCYTKNMLARDDLFTGIGLRSNYLDEFPTTTWTMEDGYPEDKNVTYPTRVTMAGRNNGLRIELYTNTSELNDFCLDKGNGFEVYIHNPAEVMTLSSTFYKVNLNTELDIALKPDRMTTVKQLERYSPEHRGCYFPHERKLSYYKVYTLQNCEMECLIKETLKSCDCVSYYMPRDERTRICGITDIQCVKGAKDRVYSPGLKSSVGENRCNCLMPCTSLHYEAETLLNVMGEEPTRHPRRNGIRTVINVYFKRDSFIPFKRRPMYDIVEFLGNCGGYLGLFSGCGLLGIMEMIYHATIRLYYNWRNQKKETKKEEATEQNVP